MSNCACDSTNGVVCMFHRDLDAEILHAALHPYTVNVFENGEESTRYFSDIDAAKEFVSLAGPSFVECNFALEGSNG